ncbi:MAG: glycoside hydrolase family 16 protein [Planctomycetaceae bacterium]|jgi:beta-glucanase (GH16 family)|nr:glycoside hydrolase family 16 protein [Planctomycetaceae bacterium]
MKYRTLLAGLFFIFATSAATFMFSADPPKPFSGGSEKFTKLIWFDEFDNNGLPDPEKWGYETGYIRNGEKQYYTGARTENAEVRDGFLVITARKDEFQNGGKTYPITSASVISKGKGFWNRGRIEVSAKVPKSLGTWPAVWMLPEDKKSGWPRCGEIDILEHVGFDPQKVHFNIHVDKYNHTKKNNKGKSVICTDPDTKFHVYAVEWFDDRIDFYFDAEKVFSYTNEGEGETSWPFDKPFYLILNLAFGGSWGGAKGIDESSLPQQFLIDYVRVWQ